MYDQRHKDSDSLQWLVARMEMLRRLELEEVEEENYWFKDAEPQTLQNKAIAQTPDSSALLKATDPGIAAVNTNSGATVNQSGPKKAEEKKNAQPVKEQKKTNTGTAKKQTGQKQKQKPAEAKKTEAKADKPLAGQGNYLPNYTTKLPVDATYYQNKQNPDINQKAQERILENKQDYERKLNNFKTNEKTNPVPTAAGKALLFWVEQLKNPSKRSYAVIRLYELKEQGGWQMLLIESGGNTDSARFVQSVFKKWLNAYPEFKEFLTDLSKDHTSVLGDYAIAVLAQNNLSESVDKNNFVLTLKGKLNFCKAEAAKIVGKQNDPAVQSFVNLINKRVQGDSASETKPLEELSVAELAEVDLKTEHLIARLFAIDRVATSLKPLLKKPDEASAKTSHVDDSVSSAWYNLRSAMSKMPCLYFPKYQKQAKEADALLNELTVGKTSGKITKASLTDLMEQVGEMNNALEKVIQNLEVENAKEQSTINLLQLKRVLYDYRFKLKGLQQMLPNAATTAESDPAAFSKFRFQLQKEFNYMFPRINAAADAVFAVACANVFKDGGYTNINNAAKGMSAEAQKRVNEYIASNRILEQNAGRLLDLILSEEKSGQAVNKQLKMLTSGSDYKKAISFATAFGTANKNLLQNYQVVKHSLYEIGLVMATIFSAGLLSEVTLPLLGLEMAETGMSLAWLAEQGGALTVESFYFTFIHKGLTTATGGEANGDNFSEDFLKNTLTFGALKGTGAGYGKATEKFVALSKLQKGLKGAGAIGTEATTLQGTDYLNYLYENSKLKAEDKQDYKLGDSVIHNLAFLAGLKLGNRLLLENGINHGENEAEIKANERIIEKIGERMQEAKTRPLTQAEIQQFNATTIKLARQNEAALRKAARNEKKYSKEEREAFGKQATELANQVVETRTFDLQTYNLRQSPGNPNLVYFEGDGNSLKEHLHLKKGDSFTKQKASENWVLKRKDGEETTYVNTKVKENTPEWLDKIDHKEIQKIATIFENNKIDRAIIDKFSTKQVEHLLRANDLFAKKDVIGAGKEMDMAFADAGFINKETRSNIENAFAFENKTTAPDFYRIPKVELNIGGKLVYEKPTGIYEILNYGANMETLKSELENIGESTEGLSDVEIVKLLLRKGFGARGPNTNLEHHVNKGDKQETALRGATELPSYPGSDIGAMHWADEGGYVFVLKDVPSWDVNAIFFKNSIKSNKTGEVEHSIGAQILP
ncbi:MAG: hypothetical protein IT236_19010, partial [Bacteroidia bacterium]|nr:hypothetical protein [Bacteroidia bacterium]